MNSKIIIPIVIAISAIVTAGIMFSLGIDNQTQIAQTPQTEIIYVEKTVSEFFDGTNNAKKISSQEELKEILETSSLLGGNFYDNKMFRTSMAESMEGFSGMDSDVMMAVSTAKPSKLESGGSEYSTTNVQV